MYSYNRLLIPCVSVTSIVELYVLYIIIYLYLSFGIVVLIILLGSSIFLLFRIFILINRVILHSVGSGSESERET